MIWPLALLSVLAGGQATIDQVRPAQPRAEASSSAQVGVSSRRVDIAPAPSGSGRPVEQLAKAPRSAEPPPGPAPNARRKTAVEPVVGQDRCDPRAAPSETGAECVRPIEARAADFPPPPSADETLIGDMKPMGAEAQAAAREIARGGTLAPEAAQAAAFQATLALPAPPISGTAPGGGVLTGEGRPAPRGR